MKNYQHWGTETLEYERRKLLEDIEEWEHTLRDQKSIIIIFSLTNYIRRAKEKIHAIDAELCYRQYHKGE